MKQTNKQTKRISLLKPLSFGTKRNAKCSSWPQTGVKSVSLSLPFAVQTLRCRHKANEPKSETADAARVAGHPETEETHVC